MRNCESTTVRTTEYHIDCIARDFLCAGGSALLLAVAHLQAEYWPLLLIALVPFLWRVARCTSVVRAAWLGFLLANCYFMVTFPSYTANSPLYALRILLYINIAFTTFGFLSGAFRKLIGFNPVYTAAAWLPIEYTLSEFTAVGQFFSADLTGGQVLITLASLLGFLMVAFVIVLVNSLIVAAVNLALARTDRRLSHNRRRIWKRYGTFNVTLPARPRWSLPGLRSPPAFPVASCN